jgi:alpha-beta hydrolase superfamily lysophospholipase
MAHPSRAIRILAAALSVATAVPTSAWARSGCRGTPARQTADFASRGPRPVGVRTLRLGDQTRATPPHGSFAGTPFRTLDTEVWYPAATPPTGTALRDAPLDTAGAPYPLVLYGHALQDSRLGEAYLAEHLASRGYVVAAVDFPLGKLGAPGGATPDDLASQPDDLRAVLEHLLAGDGGLAGAVDAERIGASGLSLGAATVMLLAYHRDLRDRRIRAILPIAPPFSCAFTRSCSTPCQPALPMATLAFDRQHELTRIVAAAFFDAHLGGDRSARCWLARGLAGENPDLVTRRR